jgi:nucleoside-diphosphate-sugar epimerase
MPSKVFISGALGLTRCGAYSIEKARRVLGYEPKVSLEEGMRRTEEWLRAEGALAA